MTEALIQGSPEWLQARCGLVTASPVADVIASTKSGWGASRGNYMAELIAETMGVDIDIETDDQRLRPEKSEVERLWADNAKAKRLTGWTPEYAGRAGFKRGLSKIGFVISI